MASSRIDRKANGATSSSSALTKIVSRNRKMIARYGRANCHARRTALPLQARLLHRLAVAREQPVRTHSHGVGGYGRRRVSRPGEPYAERPMRRVVSMICCGVLLARCMRHRRARSWRRRTRSTPTRRSIPTTIRSAGRSHGDRRSRRDRDVHRAGRLLRSVEGQVRPRHRPPPGDEAGGADRQPAGQPRRARLRRHASSPSSPNRTSAVAARPLRHRRLGSARHRREHAADRLHRRLRPVLRDARRDARRRRRAPTGRRPRQGVHRRLCRARTPAFYPYVGTNNSARDMDAIRAALGEATISYFGFSYGSELGCHVGDAVPDTVRAAVLDGAVDPTADEFESDLQQAEGFEASLDTFLAACDADAEVRVQQRRRRRGRVRRPDESRRRAPVPERATAGRRSTWAWPTPRSPTRCTPRRSGRSWRRRCDAAQRRRRRAAGAVRRVLRAPAGRDVRQRAGGVPGDQLHGFGRAPDRGGGRRRRR